MLIWEPRVALCAYRLSTMRFRLGPALLRSPASFCRVLELIFENFRQTRTSSSSTYSRRLTLLLPLPPPLPVMTTRMAKLRSAACRSMSYRPSIFARLSRWKRFQSSIRSSARAFRSGARYSRRSKSSLPASLASKNA